MDKNNEERRSVKKRKTKSMMIISVDFEQQPFQIHNYIHTYTHMIHTRYEYNEKLNCRLKSKLNMYV